MAVIRFGTFLDTLKTQLEGRGGLSGVTVSTGPLGTDTPRSHITLGVDVDQTDVMATMSYTLDEAYSVSCVVYALVSGSNEAAIKSARDLAIGWLQEVRDELEEDASVAGSCAQALVSSWLYESEIADPPGRAARISFTIEVRDVAR